MKKKGKIQGDFSFLFPFLTQFFISFFLLDPHCVRYVNMVSSWRLKGAPDFLLIRSLDWNHVCMIIVLLCSSLFCFCFCFYFFSLSLSLSLFPSFLLPLQLLPSQSES